MISQLIEEMCRFIRRTVRDEYRRDFGVIAVSGGIDSAVTLALAARALTPERVRAVLMPERENSANSTNYALELCDGLGVSYLIDDLTDALVGIGCYRRRDAAVQDLFPEYQAGTDKFSIHLRQDLLGSRMPAQYSFRITQPDGTVLNRRPSPSQFRSVLAASNFKQRLRTANIYYRAEVFNACVIGTSNFDEEYLGFFVKVGDGTWDLCPIEGLTKTQVRQVAEELMIPASILNRPTTTDTFAGDDQTQEDMFYGLPFDKLDPALDGMRSGKTNAEIASASGITEAEAANLRLNLLRRHRSTQWNRVSARRFSSWAE